MYGMNKKEEHFVADLRTLCERHKVAIIPSADGFQLHFDNPRHNSNLVYSQSEKTKEFLPKEVFIEREERNGGN